MLEKTDKLVLLESAPFRRFLLAMIQSAGVFDVTATMADGRHLYLEGRRSLALEILRDLDEAQPVSLPAGIPAATLIQTLHELAHASRKENVLERRNIHAEFGDDA
ncbi:MAG: hypothetical protein JWN66_3904 [Sphingomonas bacterium]|uniref:Bbp19 family protein n=1 Tax=Sphingomonas bacterium TaxID=1895847 RepID=UPI0026219ED5|nr:hypothetical protein [Sphingomonas bacterium]MDB5706788.1 hypothetical protein [Sphingomonas bacterium]